MRKLLFLFLIFFTLQTNANECEKLFSSQARVVFNNGLKISGAALTAYGITSGIITHDDLKMAMAILGGMLFTTGVGLDALLWNANSINLETRKLTIKKIKQVTKNSTVLKFWLEKKLPVNAQDINDNTLLHWVNDVESAQILIEHGADPFIENKEGFNAIEYHKTYGLYEITNYLKKYLNTKKISKNQAL